MILYQVTCIIVACKYEEIDDNIPLMSNIIRHFTTRVMPLSDVPPNFEDIVEGERTIMNFFNWDLMILMPHHFVRSYLANGVLFENEAQAAIDVAKKISDKS